MFAEVTYKVRVNIPGASEYNYEELSARVVQSEGGPEMTGEDMLRSAMSLCRSNTMMAKKAAATRAAKAPEKAADQPKEEK